MYHLHFVVVVDVVGGGGGGGGVVQAVVVDVVGGCGGRLDHLGGSGSHLELGHGSAGDGGVEFQVVVVAGEIIDDLLDGRLEGLHPLGLLAGGGVAGLALPGAPASCRLGASHEGEVVIAVVVDHDGRHGDGADPQYRASARCVGARGVRTSGRVVVRTIARAPDGFV